MNSVKSYQAVQHETTDRGGVLLLLHDGLIREIRRAKLAIRREKPPVSHILKAQMGVVELDRTLNFKAGAELAESLHQIYLHSLWTLSEVLETQDVESLDRIEGLFMELRDAWAQAAVASRQAKRAG